MKVCLKTSKHDLNKQPHPLFCQPNLVVSWARLSVENQCQLPQQRNIWTAKTWMQYFVSHVATTALLLSQNGLRSNLSRRGVIWACYMHAKQGVWGHAPPEQLNTQACIMHSYDSVQQSQVNKHQYLKLVIVHLGESCHHKKIIASERSTPVLSGSTVPGIMCE